MPNLLVNRHAGRRHHRPTSRRSPGCRRRGCSTNLQAAIDANSRPVVAIGNPLPGSRNDHLQTDRQMWQEFRHFGPLGLAPRRSRTTMRPPSFRTRSSPRSPTPTSVPAARNAPALPGRPPHLNADRGRAVGCPNGPTGSLSHGPLQLSLRIDSLMWAPAGQLYCTPQGSTGERSQPPRAKPYPSPPTRAGGWRKEPDQKLNPVTAHRICARLSHRPDVETRRQRTR